MKLKTGLVFKNVSGQVKDDLLAGIYFTDAGTVRHS